MRAALFEFVVGFSGAAVFSLGGIAAILCYIRSWHIACGVCTVAALFGIGVVYRLSRKPPRRGGGIGFGF